MKSSLSTNAAETKVAAKATANEAVEANKEDVKAEKKPAAKKTTTAKKATTTKKATEAKTTTTAKKTTKKAVDVNPTYILQYSGKEIVANDILTNVKTAWVEKFQGKLEEIKSIEIYLKPEEHKAYFVVNGLSNGDYFVEI